MQLNRLESYMIFYLMELNLEVIHKMKAAPLTYTWLGQRSQVEVDLDLMQTVARQIYNTCYNVINRN